MFTHFTSDTHYGHKNILEYSNRPFASIEEHDAELERRYCETVNESSVVLFVGDVSLYKGADWVRALLSRLPGKKALVRGNHDDGVTACLKMGFDLVVDSMHLYIADKKVNVCHYPPAGATKDVRYLDRRPPAPAKGEFVMHGHTHQPKKRVGRLLHVGVDAWDFRPATLAEIEQLIRNPG